MDIAVARPETRGIRVWARRGSWAIVDQVLFSSSALAINLVLARKLSPPAYGAFAVVYLLFMLLTTLHTTVLIEPMLVYGAGKYRNSLGSYFRLVVKGHVVASIAVSAMLLIAAASAALAHATTLAWTLAALAAAAPVVLLAWLLRRAFYVELRPQCAAVGDALFVVLTVAGLAMLAAAGRLDPATAILAMAAAALVASALFALLLKTELGVALPFRAVIRDHWLFGRWSALGEALHWTSIQSIVLLVPLVLGLRSAAIVAAAFNLFRPLHPVMQSVTGLMLPELSRRASDVAFQTDVRRRLRRLILPCALGVSLYAVTLAAFAPQILHLVYGGRYDHQRVVVALLGATYVSATVVQVLCVVLKTTGNVRLVPVLWGLPGLVTLPLAVPVLRIWGLTGGLVLLNGGLIAATAVAWTLIRRAERP